MRRQVNPKKAADTLRRAGKLPPRLAIVLGSGFQSIAQAMTVTRSVPYAKLTGFPKPTVAGHTGQALFGTLGSSSKKEILVLSGRAHYYEGHSLETLTFPIRVLAEYGIKNILLTNAAGGINKKFRAGEFMQFTDHLNFIGENPLRGPLAKGRERFIDLSQTYDPLLNKALQAAARKTKTKLHRGVYCALSGPSYETPAEICALAKLGANAVGMSTVPEAIVARQCGLRVAALSCITNPAAGISKTPLSHLEVLEIGEQASTQAAKLITEFSVGKMPAAH